MYKVKDLVSIWEFSKQCWPIVTGTFQQLIHQDKEPGVIYVTSQVLFLSFYFFQFDGDGDFSAACYHVLESVSFPFRRIEVSILNPCEDWVNDKSKFSWKMVLDTRVCFEWEEIQVKGIGFSCDIKQRALFFLEPNTMIGVFHVFWSRGHANLLTACFIPSSHELAIS